MEEKFTEKQLKFVDEYVANGGNGAKAAIEAGYSESSARTEAARTLAKVHIWSAIEKRRRSGLTARDVKIDYLIGHLWKIATEPTEGPNQLKAIAMLMEWAGNNLEDQKDNTIRLAYSLPNRRGGRAQDASRQVIDVKPVAEKILSSLVDYVSNLGVGSFFVSQCVERKEEPIEKPSKLLDNPDPLLGW